MYLAKRDYDVFNNLFRQPLFGREGNASTKLMRTDVSEVDGNYVVDVELPGFAKEDIQVDLKDGCLTISATRSFTKEDDSKFIRRERFEGTCKRSFYVGESLTNEDVKAAYQDGVLRLSFPKEKEVEAEEAKHIEIE